MFGGGIGCYNKIYNKTGDFLHNLEPDPYYIMIRERTVSSPGRGVLITTSKHDPICSEL